MFVRSLTTTTQPTRRRKSTSAVNTQKKNNSRLCFFRKIGQGDRIHVCRDFLLSTLSIGRDTFHRWTDIPINDSSDEMPCNLRQSLALTNRRNVLIWLDTLPKVPSHYCRRSSKKTYVESTFRSINHMLAVYRSSIWTTTR